MIRVEAYAGMVAKLLRRQGDSCDAPTRLRFRCGVDTASKIGNGGDDAAGEGGRRSVIG